MEEQPMYSQYLLRYTTWTGNKIFLLAVEHTRVLGIDALWASICVTRPWLASHLITCCRRQHGSVSADWAARQKRAASWSRAHVIIGTLPLQAGTPHTKGAVLSWVGRGFEAPHLQRQSVYVSPRGLNADFTFLFCSGITQNILNCRCLVKMQRVERRRTR